MRFFLHEPLQILRFFDFDSFRREVVGDQQGGFTQYGAMGRFMTHEDHKKAKDMEKAEEEEQKEDNARCCCGPRCICLLLTSQSG